MINNIEYHLTELNKTEKNIIDTSEIYEEFLTPDSSYRSKSSEDTPNDIDYDANNDINLYDYINYCDSIKDRVLALSLSYETNYKIMDLNKIADYYGILLTKLQNNSYNDPNNTKGKKKYVKKKKDELIEDIVNFEEDELNANIVYRRKQLWFYIDELKTDKYLQKHIIFNI